MRPPPVRESEKVIVEPIDLVAGGAALSKLDGFAIFTHGIYPGDRARIVVREVKKNYANADLDELLQAGPLRRSLPCPVAGECGGCDWTSLRLDHQLAFKRKILLDSLARIGRFDVSELPPLRIHPSPLNYRIRSRLHRDDEGQIGFYAYRSHRVVPLPEECEVVGPAVIASRQAIADAAAASNASSIVTFENGREFVVDLTQGRSDFDEDETSEGQGASPATIDAGLFHYSLATTSFFQVNRHLLARLIGLVSSIAEQVSSRGSALDLYSGVGFFTLPLSKLFQTVVAVERSTASAPFASLNARPYPNIECLQDSVETYVQRAKKGRFDFVMVDPPRAGIRTAVLDAIDRINPRTICYLSCDPVTFSRDSAHLSRRGWILRTLDLIDLFPNTHHIETLASFRREKSSV